MNKASPWRLVAFGLSLKLVAMWMIFPSMLFPFFFPSYTGLVFAALCPLLVDLVGRSYCVWAPVTETRPIKLSLLAQFTGVIGLAVMPILLGLAGVMIGLLWAVVFQISAAKAFVKHLKAIALTIDQPEIAHGIDQLRRRLLATSMSLYGNGSISVVVLSCAIVFGLFAYGLGLLITIPLAFLFLMPLVMTTMVLYFLMLYSYERYLSQLRRALYSFSESSREPPPSDGSAYL